MELLTIIFTLLILSPLAFPFIVVRIAIYCLSFYLKRKHSIVFSVAKSGLISFRTIVISIPTACREDHESRVNSGPDHKRTMTITIDGLRLSSLYLDNTCASIISITCSNLSIEMPTGDGEPLAFKIRSVDLPIDKIRGDFLRHYMGNFNVLIKDFVVILDKFSYKIEKFKLTRSQVESKDGFQIYLDRIIYSDLSIPEVKHSSDMPEELTQQRMLFIEQMNVDYQINQSKTINITINGDCFLQWNLEFHTNFVSLITNIKESMSKLKKNEEKALKSSNGEIASQVTNMKIELNGRLSMGALISENQTVCMNTHSFDVNASFPGPFTLQSKLLCCHFDEHTILTGTSMSVSYYPSPGLPGVLDRKQNNCGIKLNDDANSLLVVQVESVSSLFPYKYNFANTFNEKLMGTYKWLKKYHAKPSKVKLQKKPIGCDMNFRINKLVFEIENDPFETKLRNNYMLLEDEYHEQLARDQNLQDKINEMKRNNMMPTSSNLEDTYKALAKKNSEIYIQRSKQLYSSDSRLIPLFSIVIEDADMKLLADSSFHDHSDMRTLLKTFDPENPITDDIMFSTLFCRVISADFKSVEMSLRDFPLPLLSMKDLTMKGQILGAEQEAVARARRNCNVYFGRNREPVSVERSMTPLKFFHNLQLRSTLASYTHGPCWDPVLQQVSLAFDDIISASSDPSPSLAWWDKMRFLFHGQIKLNCNQLSIMLHASNDPYNQTELIELTMSRSQVEMLTGKIRIKCDLDALVHTASKYDECRSLHFPNLDVKAFLSWNCLGNPNDHYSIMPCAPDKVPDYSSHHSHDSYRSFRSQNLDLNLTIETQFTSPTSSMNPDNMPSMLFFGSTIRWLENQKFIYMGPSRLTRRGVLFKNTRPRKPSLSRIFKDVKVRVSLNRFQILYWSSVSKRHGIQMMAGQYNHQSEHTLKLVTNSSDGLKHRAQADWQTTHMRSSLDNVEIWLYNLGSEELDQFNDFYLQSNSKNRQYFLSLKRISYNKEDQVKKVEMMHEYEMSSNDNNIDTANNDMQSNVSDEHVPNHRLVVHDLKAAWTKENRDVVVGIFDAYINSQQLKKNLSTEALKPILIDNPAQVQHAPSLTSSSPPHRHQRHPSTTSLITTNLVSPVSSVSKNRAVSMLQKLIADSENNPNVYTEESHSGVASETHLYGVEACQMDDVVAINCLIELINSQVVLCGTETSGYVIVSAANTEIQQATHLPVWKNRTLFSKTTWTGSLRCMQYYATVDGQSDANSSRMSFANQNDIQWLDPDDIDSRGVIHDFPDLVGSGHSVGGVVSAVVGKLGQSDDDCSLQIQLQRIISRCNCLFYYAGHTEGVPDHLQHLIPPLPDDEIFIEPWDKEVGVDSFSLTHQDLDISTNSQQYAMIMDIINNLLLFVEPHKKTAFENMERMRFRFELSADEDQRVPISALQDQVRKYVAYLRRLERERYLVYRASIDESMMTETDHDYRLSLNTLSSEIANVKEQLNSASEELAMMISCYKEIQLGAHKAQKQQAATQQGTGAFFANVIKRSEICFKSARWRVTDSDGQLGLADISLNNFLYSKVVKSDDSVEHTIELGHLHVSNLIPNQAYKDVLHPTELQANIPLDRQRALRVYCRELAPVAGIPVKEHLEVNVVPFTIEVTLQFFQKMVKFFFPEKDSVKEDKSKKSLEPLGDGQMSRFGSKRRNKDKLATALADGSTTLASGGGSGKSVSSFGSGSGVGGRSTEDTISTASTATMNSNNTVSSLNSNLRRGEEIEKMRERAAKNHTFVYVKVPGIPIKVSYKGKKQKNVTDLKNMSLTLPTYEYHNSTWTWLDLLMAVKNDSKHTVIKQAFKQKMKIRPSSIWSKSSNSDQHSPSLESSPKEKCTTPVTDEDKARLLLGQYAKWRNPTSTNQEPEPSANRVQYDES